MKKIIIIDLLFFLIVGVLVVTPVLSIEAQSENEEVLIEEVLIREISEYRAKVLKSIALKLQGIETEVAELQKKIFSLEIEIKIREIQEQVLLVQKEVERIAFFPVPIPAPISPPIPEQEIVPPEILPEDLIPVEEPVVEPVVESPPTQGQAPFTGGSGGPGGPASAPTPQADTTAPAAVTDLSTSEPTFSSIKLNWTSPGDDNNSGTAASYDIRYSITPITAENWSIVALVDNEPSPLLAGSPQSMTITGLSWGTLYYFAIKTSDEAANTSGLSNVVSQATNVPEECAVPIVSGRRTYFTHGTGSQPQIMRIDIDNLATQFGGTQTISVQIRDTADNPITLVKGLVQLDNSRANFSFSLFSGSETNGTWSGSWSVIDTFCHNYTLSITATSGSGTSKVDLTFR